MSATVQAATKSEVDDFIAKNAGWSVITGQLVRTFEAASFLAGIDLVKAVALKAEAADHHPDIDIRWRKITFRLITHDAGNAISHKDLSLAAEIQQLAR